MGAATCCLHFLCILMISMCVSCFELLMSNTPSSPSFFILGGTGRIGTAVASHLLQRSPHSSITLAGRDPSTGQSAVDEIRNEHKKNEPSIRFQKLDWKENPLSLEKLFQKSKFDCIIHVAGPYLGEETAPLKAAIAAGCQAYVDVSDPLDYIEASLSLQGAAEKSGTTALISAGAFPGMSNVLAIEASSLLPLGTSVRDVRFNYFTAGLGGSGDINLFITNIGFGEPMVQYEQGKLTAFETLSGSILGKVPFFLDDRDVEHREEVTNTNKKLLGDETKVRIGTQTVFSWPFPEAATVPRELNATGYSYAAMGTAPHIWNIMLGVLVSIVPRAWWRSNQFSKFLADFSQPLVRLSDALLKLTAPDKVGETHAMRVDIVGETNSRDRTSQKNQEFFVSVVQAHESFRRCVGQSCAEFALDLLENSHSPGVFLPEQLYSDDNARERIIEHLTQTPGTISYSGAQIVSETKPPSLFKKSIEKAKASGTTVEL